MNALQFVAKSINDAVGLTGRSLLGMTSSGKGWK